LQDQQNLDNCIGEFGNKASHGCLILGQVKSRNGESLAWSQENSIEFLEPRASSFLLSPPRVWEFDPGIQTAVKDLSNQISRL
jgi:hypothetical protein